MVLTSGIAGGRFSTSASTPRRHEAVHTRNRLPGGRSHNRRVADSGTGGAGRFLTLAETAEVLNISVHQAYGLVRSGELPAIKIGGNGQWRVERTVLESFIEAKYEESRRMNLWKQADYTDIPELTFDSRRD
jgi:excisionase family DNA binding protein